MVPKLFPVYLRELIKESEFSGNLWRLEGDVRPDGDFGRRNVIPANDRLQEGAKSSVVVQLDHVPGDHSEHTWTRSNPVVSLRPLNIRIKWI
ncbi:hypothetical protein RRG08_051835 [Elysia crispata]|uniref:Uncharacterized protein n=1 Tax=Elysia crispata TaxID=231223 RepID=A0AAE1DC98_9GAST|nr:hypothetical protein RRG08_051835 [Elysia crispata]